MRPQTLAGISEAKKPLGRNMCKWEDIINMELKEMRHEVMTCRHWPKHNN
jgi:hypothetical protein